MGSIAFVAQTIWFVVETPELRTTVDPGIKVIVPLAVSCGKHEVPEVVIVKV